jgi:hypothetical protein
VKLADAFGMSGKPVTLYLSKKDVATLERFVFFLAAYVAGAEDVQEIRLGEFEDSEAEDEEEQENGTPSYSAIRPAISVRSLSSNTTGGKVDRRIASGRFTEEEENEVKAALLELIDRFISFKEKQRKVQMKG